MAFTSSTLASSTLGSSTLASSSAIERSLKLLAKSQRVEQSPLRLQPRSSRRSGRRSRVILSTIVPATIVPSTTVATATATSVRVIPIRAIAIRVTRGALARWWHRVIGAAVAHRQLRL